MRVRSISLDDPHAVSQFITFPFTLYRDCPQWAPPLLAAARYTLNPRHPFYEHSTAKFFLAESDDQVLGRIGVMNNRNFNQYTNAQTAFIGFFESVNDPTISDALFQAAFNWARSHRLDRILGPRGLIGSDSHGLLVDGFDCRPALGIPYNFPYYESLFQQAGFEKDLDHISGFLRGDQQLPEKAFQTAEKISALRGYTIRTFRKKADLYAWIPRLVEVQSRIFANTYLYFPPTEAELISAAEDFIAITDPFLIKVVMKDDHVAGFILSYRDFASALQKSRGSLWPLGWWYILLERSRKEWLDINCIGFLPEYQGEGCNSILYASLARSIQASHFKNIEIIQVNETNQTVLNELEEIGVTWHKRHRSYRKELF